MSWYRLRAQFEKEEEEEEEVWIDTAEFIVRFRTTYKFHSL